MNEAQQHILNVKIKEVNNFGKGRYTLYFDDNTYICIGRIWNQTVSKHFKEDTGPVFCVWLKKYLIKNIDKFKLERLNYI
jgi:hypothetical protein